MATGPSFPFPLGSSPRSPSKSKASICSSSSPESSAYTTSTEEESKMPISAAYRTSPLEDQLQQSRSNNQRQHADSSSSGIQQKQQEEDEDEDEDPKGKGKLSCNLHVPDSCSDSYNSYGASPQLLITSKTAHAAPTTANFKRGFFSEDDEIVILKGMAEYQASNNGLIQVLSHSISDLHVFLSKSLHTQVSIPTLYKKIGRLKQKYKEERGGRGNFSNDHDRVVYNLSKKVWGDFVSERLKKRTQPISNKEPTEKRLNLEKNEENYSFLSGAANKWMKNLGAAGSTKAADWLDVGKAKRLEKKLKEVKTLEMHYHAEEMAIRHKCWLFMAETMTR